MFVILKHSNSDKENSIRIEGYCEDYQIAFEYIKDLSNKLFKPKNDEYVFMGELKDTEIEDIEISLLDGKKSKVKSQFIPKCIKFATDKDCEISVKNAIKFHIEEFNSRNYWYKEKSKQKLKEEEIKEEDVKNITIEEFIMDVCEYNYKIKDKYDFKELIDISDTVKQKEILNYLYSNNYADNTVDTSSYIYSIVEVFKL